MSYVLRPLFLMLMLTVIAVFTTGCATTKESVKVVRQTKTVYLSIPDSLTTPVIPSRPVEKPIYMSYTDKEKELYLNGVVLDLYKNLNTCNGNLTSIRKLQGTMKEAVTHESKP